MLFKVEMTVNIPASMPKDQADAIKAEEKAYSQRLQREGKWLHIWRVAGLYANVSIFDVADNQELHDILTGLPLYPFMAISVQPLVSAAKSTYLPSLYCATFFAMGSSGTFQGSRASSFSRLSASPICAST